ncbi:MAG: hypothetical protein LBM19_02795 [Holosporales bacterium]|jgi:putative ABC transport system permease protein|nr:hypothetical protein [Holosporales bacterium]
MLNAQELLTSLDVGLIFGVVAIGIYLTFRTINFADLTCDGSFVFGAAVTAVLVKQGFNPYFALVVSSAAGVVAGFLTGILHVKFKISDLLSGIIVAFMLYSINLRIMGDSPNITFIDEATTFSNAFSNRNTTLTIATLIAPIALSLIYLLFSGFGLRLRAVGYNKQLASINGTNVKLTTIVGLMISNAIISLGGGMFSQYQGFCDISQGTGTLVAGLASVVIGEKILPFRREPLIILSCVVGSVLYRIFINMALHSDILGVKTQDVNLITGITIIAIMVIKRRKQNA